MEFSLRKEDKRFQPRAIGGLQVSLKGNYRIKVCLGMRKFNFWRLTPIFHSENRGDAVSYHKQHTANLEIELNCVTICMGVIIFLTSSDTASQPVPDWSSNLDLLWTKQKYYKPIILHWSYWRILLESYASSLGSVPSTSKRARPSRARSAMHHFYLTGKSCSLFDEGYLPDNLSFLTKENLITEIQLSTLTSYPAIELRVFQWSIWCWHRNESDIHSLFLWWWCKVCFCSIYIYVSRILWIPKLGLSSFLVPFLQLTCT